MMKKLLYKSSFLLIIAVILSGCTSHLKTIREALFKVDVTDGVTQEEAYTIARNELVNVEYDHFYNGITPKLYTNIEKIPGKDNYWFIEFNRIRRGLASNYIVAINKGNGAIKFSGIIYPERNWILEAAFYR